MTNQEAIKSLENIVEYWTCRPTEVEAAKMAIKALKKQIPKKPIRVSNNRTDGCPECKTEYYEKF